MTRVPRSVAIIQARLRSTRLPGKVLLDLGGKTALERVVERCRAIPGVSDVVVALPDGPADAPLRAHCDRLGFRFSAGSESDVLDRYYQAARAARADVVLRITSDCPLLDPAVAGRVLRALLESGADYANNVCPPTFPDGLDVEAFRFSALELAWRKARKPAEREHVTVYLRDHPELFRFAAVTHSRDLSDFRWTLDEPRDLEFLRAVFGKINGRSGMEDILKLLKKEPALMKINDGIKPNEGYYKGFLKESPIKAKRIQLARSRELYARARGLIPGSSQTFSKGPDQFVRGAAPLFLKRGKGARVWDVDGNQYLDTVMALAPVSLGYADPDVNAAVGAQLEDGTILSQPHPLEAEVAGTLREIVPGAEMSRFLKNGSDATSAAVRVARAATERDMIAAGGYHGWHDWYIGTTTRSVGVPVAIRRLTKTFVYNDISSLYRLFRQNPGRIAAVILEPVGVEEPKNDFLNEVAALTKTNGALLIFDEVVTGFRLSLGGGQEHFGVQADLCCFGKAMANGFPLSAVTGRKKYMRLFEAVFVSTTFGGELLSLAAAQATLSKMRSRPIIPHLWQQGRRLRDGFNTLARETGMEKHARCVGLPPHSVIPFTAASGEAWWDLKSLFQQECVRRGLLFMATHNPCWALTPAEVDQALRVYAAVLPLAREAVETRSVRRRLEGIPVGPIFRKP